MNTPNSKYDHVFAIVRVDTFQDPDFSFEEMVTVKKIVWNQTTAKQEVERLNKLNGAKECVYFWQMTRLEKSRLTQTVEGQIDVYAVNGHMNQGINHFIPNKIKQNKV